MTIINLGDFELPLFDEDLEHENGPPENATKLKKSFLEHDGLLIASPEYNSSISPLLKNVIDWVSRPVEGEPRLACYQGKVATIIAGAPGALGGLRGLVHVWSILSSIGVIVLPNQVAIPNAYDAFNADLHTRTKSHCVMCMSTSPSVYSNWASFCADDRRESRVGGWESN